MSGQSSSFRPGHHKPAPAEQSSYVPGGDGDPSVWEKPHPLRVRWSPPWAIQVLFFHGDVVGTSGVSRGSDVSGVVCTVTSVSRLLGPYPFPQNSAKVTRAWVVVLRGTRASRPERQDHVSRQKCRIAPWSLPGWCTSRRYVSMQLSMSVSQRQTPWSPYSHACPSTSHVWWWVAWFFLGFLELDKGTHVTGLLDVADTSKDFFSVSISEVVRGSPDLVDDYGASVVSLEVMVNLRNFYLLHGGWVRHLHFHFCRNIVMLVQGPFTVDMDMHHAIQSRRWGEDVITSAAFVSVEGAARWCCYLLPLLHFLRHGLPCRVVYWCRSELPSIKKNRGFPFRSHPIMDGWFLIPLPSWSISMMSSFALAAASLSDFSICRRVDVVGCDWFVPDVLDDVFPEPPNCSMSFTLSALNFATWTFIVFGFHMGPTPAEGFSTVSSIGPISIFQPFSAAKAVAKPFGPLFDRMRLEEKDVVVSFHEYWLAWGEWCEDDRCMLPFWGSALPMDPLLVASSAVWSPHCSHLSPSRVVRGGCCLVASVTVLVRKGDQVSFPEVPIPWLVLSGFLSFWSILIKLTSCRLSVALVHSCRRGGGKRRSASLVFLAPGRLPSFSGNCLPFMFAGKGALWWHGRPIAPPARLRFACFSLSCHRSPGSFEGSEESGTLAALLRSVCRSLVNVGNTSVSWRVSCLRNASASHPWVASVIGAWEDWNSLCVGGGCFVELAFSPASLPWFSWLRWICDLVRLPAVSAPPPPLRVGSPATSLWSSSWSTPLVFMLVFPLLRIPGCISGIRCLGRQGGSVLRSTVQWTVQIFRTWRSYPFLFWGPSFLEKSDLLLSSFHCLDEVRGSYQEVPLLGQFCLEFLDVVQDVLFHLSRVVQLFLGLDVDVFGCLSCFVGNVAAICAARSFTNTLTCRHSWDSSSCASQASSRVFFLPVSFVLFCFIVSGPRVSSACRFLDSSLSGRPPYQCPAFARHHRIFPLHLVSRIGACSVVTWCPGARLCSTRIDERSIVPSSIKAWLFVVPRSRWGCRPLRVPGALCPRSIFPLPCLCSNQRSRIGLQHKLHR